MAGADVRRSFGGVRAGPVMAALAAAGGLVPAAGAARAAPIVTAHATAAQLVAATATARAAEERLAATERAAAPSAAEPPEPPTAAEPPEPPTAAQRAAAAAAANPKVPGLPEPGETAEPPPVPVAVDGVLPEGARLQLKLNRNIATARALGPDRIAEAVRAGDAWAASLTDDVVDQDGRVRLARGAVVHGRLALAQPGHGLVPPKLELGVDSIDQRPLHARVVAAPFEAVTSGDAATTAYSGAAAGAVVGGIAFGVPGVVLGYGLGGSTGASTLAGQRRVDAWLASGTTLTIELERPLAL